MAVEDRIREAFDQLAASLRQEFEQRAQALANELTGAVTEDRMAAEADSISRLAAQVAAVRSEAEERLVAERARAREEAQKEFLAEIEGVRAELSASRAAAEASKLAAEEARAHADEQRAQADQARSEFDTLRAQADQARAEADALRAQADKARADADALRAQADQARAQATEALSQADELRAQIGDARSAFDHVRAELAELRAQADDWNGRAEEIRLEMEELRRAAAESRASADEARALADQLRRDSEESRGESDRAREEIAAAKAALQQALDRAASAEQTVLTVHGAEVVERQEQMAEIDRLSASLQRIGRAGSLSEVISALAETIAQETARTAVLVASGDGFSVFRSSGFNQPPKAPIPRDQLADVSRGLPFAPLPPDRTGYSVPVEIGGKRVALVYADDLGETEPVVPSPWPEAIEILARHAALRLELLTALRTVQMTRRAGSASAPVATIGAVAAPHTGRAATTSTEDDQSARRFARLLVSEIKLYNEAAVRVGRDRRDLSRRLGTEIERARRLYEERVPATVPARGTYFDDELVQILADGDPALLGQ